ncbi:MAG: hypothetical protein GY788_02020 [bacterium]|nr:hypothetical protein [bacterium]
MIKYVVTRGYGNGTIAGTIAYVSTRGYAIGEAVVGGGDAVQNNFFARMKMTMGL